MKSSLWLGKRDWNWGERRGGNLWQALNMPLCCQCSGQHCPAPGCTQAGIGRAAHSRCSKALHRWHPGVASAEVTDGKGDIPAHFGHWSAVNCYCFWEGKGAERDSESQVCPSQSTFHTEPGSVVCWELKFSSKAVVFSSKAVVFLPKQIKLSLRKFKGEDERYFLFWEIFPKGGEKCSNFWSWL